MAGLQAQTSTANVAPQKTEAFTPSGRLQRQGFENIEQLEYFALHIKIQIDRLKIDPGFSFVLPAWERTLKQLNEAIAFHKNPSPEPANSGVFGWASKITQQLKHAYLSHIYGLKNLGRYINLPQMEFLGLDLSGATLDGSIFTKASFAGANLEQASLRKTWLEGTNFNLANLCRTLFKGARIGQLGSTNPTIFHGATGLETAVGLPRRIDTSPKSLEAWHAKK
jgi:hypothetical protein